VFSKWILLKERSTTNDSENPEFSDLEHPSGMKLLQMSVSWTIVLIKMAVSEPHDVAVSRILNNKTKRQRLQELTTLILCHP